MVATNIAIFRRSSSKCPPGPRSVTKHSPCPRLAFLAQRHLYAVMAPVLAVAAMRRISSPSRGILVRQPASRPRRDGSQARTGNSLLRLESATTYTADYAMPTIVHTPRHYSCQPDGVPRLLEGLDLPAGRAGDDTHNPRPRPATVLHRKLRYNYQRYCLAADTIPVVRARPCSKHRVFVGRSGRCAGRGVVAKATYAGRPFSASSNHRRSY
jgi:hypothetical protein